VRFLTVSQRRKIVSLAIAVVAVILIIALVSGRREGAGTASGGASGPIGCTETNAPAESAAACHTCLKANATSKNPADDGCCGIRDPIGLQLCRAVAACMRSGGPPVGRCNLAGDTTTCYCGTHQANCDLEGRANGPCIAQIAAAAGRDVVARATDKPNPAQILARYGDTRYALGRASNAAAIAGAFCPAQCGVGK
jgi:hypothetical protein